MSRQIFAVAVRNFFNVRARCLSTKGMTTENDAGISEIDGLKTFEEIPEPKGLASISAILDYTPLRGFKVERVFDIWVKRHRQYGDIYKERVGKDYMVFCRTPQHTEEMFRQESRHPIRMTLDTITFAKESAGLPESIINLSGEEWHKHRKPINAPLLRNKIIWKYVGMQARVAEDLLAYVRRNMDKSGEVENFQFLLDRWAFEMASVFLLDCRMGLLEDSPDAAFFELFLGLNNFIEFIAKSFVGFNLWRYVQTKESKALKDSVERSYEIMSAIIEQKEKEGELDDTVLGDLLKAKNLTPEQRKSLVYDVFGASVETTSKATALVLYSLTMNEEAQEKLREEVNSLPPNDRLTGRIIDNMKYMNAFMKEVVRLLPFIHSHSRIFDKEVILSGYRIPAGINIMNTSNSTQNRNPDFFPDPDKFLPERWLEKHPPYKGNLTGAFGLGARACPGRRFAMQEIRLLLIELLRNFKVEYHYKPIESVFRGTASPSQDPQFRFIPIRR